MHRAAAVHPTILPLRLPKPKLSIHPPTCPPTCLPARQTPPSQLPTQPPTHLNVGIQGVLAVQREAALVPLHRILLRRGDVGGVGVGQPRYHDVQALAPGIRDLQGATGRQAGRQAGGQTGSA